MLNINTPSLSDITVIVPTSNRNYYLTRCLSYLSRYHFGKIIVADSSLPNKKAISKASISRLCSKSDILYLDYPEDVDKYGTSIYQKWADALSYADTAYSLFCTDKSFVVPETLKYCINYLESNPDVNTIEGVSYYIERTKSDQYRLRVMYPSRKSLMERDAYSRMLSTIDGKNTTTNQMGLRRTDFHKSLYDKLAKYGLEDIRFGEFSLEFLTIAMSKVQYINMPFSYRDIAQFTKKGNFNQNESSSLRYPTLVNYISDGVYDDIYARFSTCIVSEICRNSSCTQKDAENFMKYSAPIILKKRGFYGNFTFAQDPLWYLWRHTPQCVRDLAGYCVPKSYLNYLRDIPETAIPIIDIINKTRDNWANDAPVF